MSSTKHKSIDFYLSEKCTLLERPPFRRNRGCNMIGDPPYFTVFCCMLIFCDISMECMYFCNFILFNY